MTQQDVGILLETKLQTKGYLLYDVMDSEEIDLFVVKAAEDFVSEVLMNYRQKGRKGFEDSAKQLNELRALKKRERGVAQGGVNGVETSFPLPSDYQDYIRFLVFRGTTQAGCAIVDSEEIDDYYVDTYHGPTLSNYLGVIQGSNLIAYALDEDTAIATDTADMIYIISIPSFDSTSTDEWETPDGVTLTKDFINRVVERAFREIASTLEENQQKINNSLTDNIS